MTQVVRALSVSGIDVQVRHPTIETLVDARTAPATTPPAPDDGLDVFMRHRLPERIAKRALIYAGGPKHLFHVVDGVVQLRRDGRVRNAVMGTYGGGSWFGEAAVFEMQHPYEVAQALTECLLMRWTPAEVLKSCETPAGSLALTTIVMEHKADMEARLMESQYPIYRRLIMALLRLDRQIGRPGDAMAGVPRELPPLTHDAISQDIGTSRELVSAGMNRLRNEGAVEYSRKAIAIYPDVLRELLVKASAHE